MLLIRQPPTRKKLQKVPKKRNGYAMPPFSRIPHPESVDAVAERVRMTREAHG
jgi:hypothetical protein